VNEYVAASGLLYQEVMRQVAEDSVVIFARARLLNALQSMLIPCDENAAAAVTAEVTKQAGD